MLILVLTAIAAGVSLSLLPGLTAAASRRIAESGDSTSLMVFELLRGTAFAAAITAILFGLFSMGRACLDQATRFQKRLVAAHFLNYVLHTYKQQIAEGTIQIEEVVSFLDAWSQTVESAFSNVKFGSKNNQAIRAAVTKDGAQMETGDPRPAA